MVKPAMILLLTLLCCAFAAIWLAGADTRGRCDELESRDAALRTCLTNLLHSHDVLEASHKRSEANTFELGRDTGKDEMLRKLCYLTNKNKQTNSP